jgi:hypothetical protein
MDESLFEFESKQMQKGPRNGPRDIDTLRYIVSDFPSVWETNKAFLRDPATPHFSWITNSCLVILRNLEDHIIRTEGATSREALELNRILREIFYDAFILHPVLRRSPTKAVEALQEQFNLLPEDVRQALESESNESDEALSGVYEDPTYPWVIYTENSKSNRVHGITAYNIFEKLKLMHLKLDDKVRSLLRDIESLLSSDGLYDPEVAALPSCITNNSGAHSFYHFLERNRIARYNTGFAELLGKSKNTIATYRKIIRDTNRLDEQGLRSPFQLKAEYQKPLRD